MERGVARKRRAQLEDGEVVSRQVLRLSLLYLELLQDVADKQGEAESYYGVGCGNKSGWRGPNLEHLPLAPLVGSGSSS